MWVAHAAPRRKNLKNHRNRRKYIFRNSPQWLPCWIWTSCRLLKCSWRFPRRRGASGACGDNFGNFRKNDFFRWFRRFFGFSASGRFTWLIWAHPTWLSCHRQLDPSPSSLGVGWTAPHWRGSRELPELIWWCVWRPRITQTMRTELYLRHVIYVHITHFTQDFLAWFWSLQKKDFYMFHFR